MYKIQVFTMLVLAHVLPTTAVAQSRVIEVGTGLVQATVINGNALQVATLAGRGPLASSIFLRVQNAGGLYLEPEASLFWLTNFEGSVAALGLGLTVGRRFGAAAAAYWFGGAHMGAFVTETNGTNVDAAIGGTVGRMVSIIGGHGTIRFEGRVRHWVDLGSTNVSVLIGFGIVVSQ